MIDVVFVDAACDGEVLLALARLLTDDERARADRYRFADDRRRSIVARAAVRRLVGRAIDRDPRTLRIVEDAHGKPRLDDPAIEFNASHSGDFVAVAIAPFAVGVDVERRRDLADALALARRFFSPEEHARVAGAPDVLGAFFAIWTAKEAIVKATGEGIAASDLRSFTVPRFGEWRTESLAPPRDGYYAAVAARGDHWTAHVRTVAADSLL